MAENVIIPVEFDVKSGADKAGKEAEKILKKDVGVIPVEFDTKEARKQIDALKKKQQQLKTKIDLDIDTDKAKKQLSDVEKSLKSSQKAFSKKATIQVDGKKAKSEIDQIDKKLKGLEAPKIKPEVETGGVDAALADLQGKLTEFATLGAAGIAVAVGAAFAALIQRGGELESLFAKISARTGRVGEELEAVRDIANSLFLAGVGETVEDAANAFAIADQQLGNFLDNDAEIEAFVKGAAGIGAVFDTDINDVIAKSRTFIANFGLDGKEAADLIGLAMRDAGTQADDVLDTLSEYSPLMKQAGLNAVQFGEFLTRAVQAGARDTDRIADTIKETGLRIEDFIITTDLQAIREDVGGATGAIAAELQELSKAAELGQIDTLELLGLSATAISKAVEDGRITEVMARSLQKAIGGTPAEEIGSEVYKRVFEAPIDEDAIRKKAQEAGELITDAIDPKGFDQFARILTVEFNKLSTLIFEAVEPALEIVAAALLVVIENLKITFRVIGILLTPLGLLVDGLKFVWQQAQLLSPIVDQLKISFGIIADTIGNVLNQALNILTNLFSNIKTAIFGVTEETSGMNDELEDSGGFVDTMVAAIKIATGVIETFVKGLGGAVKWIGELLGVSDKLRKKPPLASVNDSLDSALEKQQRLARRLGEGLPPPPSPFGNVISGANKATKAVKDFFIELEQSSIAIVETTKDPLDNIATKGNINRITGELERIKLTLSEAVAPDPLAGIIIPAKITFDDGEIAKTTKSLADSFVDQLGGFQENLTTLFQDNSGKRQKAIKDELKNTSDELKKALENDEISFEDYQSKLTDAELKASEDRRELQKQGFQELSDLQISAAAGFDLLSKTMNEQFNEQLNGSGGFVELFANAMKDATDVTKDATFDMSDAFNVLSDSAGTALVVIGAEVGKAMAKGESGAKAFQGALVGLIEQTILLIAPMLITKAFAPDSGIPFPLALAGVAIGLPLVFGLLEALKPPKVGAEKGVVGITRGYNTPAGNSDKISLMVAEGEAVMSKSAVDEKGNIVSNREMLEYANRGGAMQDLVLQRIQATPAPAPQINIEAQNNTALLQSNIAMTKEISRLNKVLNDGIDVNAHTHLKISKPADVSTKKVALYRG